MTMMRGHVRRLDSFCRVFAMAAFALSATGCRTIRNPPPAISDECAWPASPDMSSEYEVLIPTENIERLNPYLQVEVGTMIFGDNEFDRFVCGDDHIPLLIATEEKTEEVRKVPYIPAFFPIILIIPWPHFPTDAIHTPLGWFLWYDRGHRGGYIMLRSSWLGFPKYPVTFMRVPLIAKHEGRIFALYNDHDLFASFAALGEFKRNWLGIWRLREISKLPRGAGGTCLALDGKMYIGSDRGVERVDLETGDLISTPKIPGVTVLADWARSIRLRSDGSILTNFGQAQLLLRDEGDRIRTWYRFGDRSVLEARIRSYLETQSEEIFGFCPSLGGYLKVNPILRNLSVEEIIEMMETRRDPEMLLDLIPENPSWNVI